MGCACCKPAPEEEEKRPPEEQDEHCVEPLAVQPQTNIEDDKSLIQPDTQADTQSENQAAEREDVRVEPLVLSSETTEDAREKEEAPPKRQRQQKKPAPRDFGISFVESSRTQHGGSVAKYMYTTKQPSHSDSPPKKRRPHSTSSLTNMDDIRGKYWRAGGGDRRRRRGRKPSAAPPGTSRQGDLSRITEQDGESGEHRPDGGGGSRMSPSPRPASAPGSLAESEILPGEFDTQSLLLDDYSESHCSVDGCDCAAAQRRREREREARLGMWTEEELADLERLDESERHVRRHERVSHRHCCQPTPPPANAAAAAARLLHGGSSTGSWAAGGASGLQVRSRDSWTDSRGTPYGGGRAGSRQTASTDTFSSEKSPDRIYLKMDKAPGEHAYNQYRIMVIRPRHDMVPKAAAGGDGKPDRGHSAPPNKNRWYHESPYAHTKPVLHYYGPVSGTKTGTPPARAKSAARLGARRTGPVNELTEL